MESFVFNQEDYESGDGMLTNVWGPSLWHFLHTMSFNYPVHPTEEEKKSYSSFIKSLEFILPCKYCRLNLKKNFCKLPLTRATMKSRESFSRYIYNLHELINKMLQKKSNLTYEKVRETYEHFRSRCTAKKRVKIRKTKKKEMGCVKPLYGEKSKCILRIVPHSTRTKSFDVDKKCFKKRE
jgi:hypothetical protein